MVLKSANLSFLNELMTCVILIYNDLEVLVKIVISIVVHFVLTWKMKIQYSFTVR